MKSILNLVAICAVVALAGCQTNKTVSPGAVGEKSGCCGSSSSCTGDKSSANTSMGAVGEKKAGCCSGDSSAKCPFSGKSNTTTNETVSPGAVGDSAKTPGTGGCCHGAAKSGG